MEQAAPEEVFKVDRVTGMRWVQGDRQYLILWEGYASKDATWELMGNLVGCAAQIREFERKREAEDLEAKEDILRRRKEKKDKAEADAAALRQAAATAMVDLPDGEGDVEGGRANGEYHRKDCMSIHKGKRAALWKAYDLTACKPTCKLFKEGSKEAVCGVCPSDSAGTTNYWAHLWSHHKQTWYELKSQEGSLSAAGVDEMNAIS